MRDLYSDPNYNWFFEDVESDDPDAQHFYTKAEIKEIDKLKP